MQTSTLNISKITTSNSATSLKDAITSIPGVSNVYVDVNSSKLTVTYNPDSVNVSKIKNIITNSGFIVH